MAPVSSPGEKGAGQDPSGKYDSHRLKRVSLDRVFGVIENVLGSVAPLLEGAECGFDTVFDGFGNNGFHAEDLVKNVIERGSSFQNSGRHKFLSPQFIVRGSHSDLPPCLCDAISACSIADT
jgi:hypothetical protein